MSKRRQTDEDEDEESAGEQTSLVDVHFDYYNIDADNDYHAIQRLLIQLFGPDAERVQTGPLTELVTRVAEESGVGSTIKTEEEEGSDPYAVLTVVSCREHAGLQGIVEYLLSRTRSDGSFHDALSEVLRKGHVGLVLSERLVNMPVQVMGPMYRMLSEEIKRAIDEGLGYRFTHYLFISRAFRPSAEEETERHAKRPRTSADGLCAFHVEDGEIMTHATLSAAYELCDSVSGRVMVVPSDRFGSLVRSIQVTYAV